MGVFGNFSTDFDSNSNMSVQNHLFIDAVNRKGLGFALRVSRTSEMLNETLFIELILRVTTD